LSALEALTGIINIYYRSGATPGRPSLSHKPRSPAAPERDRGRRRRFTSGTVNAPMMTGYADATGTPSAASTSRRRASACPATAWC
jgi:hypothetical protein